MHGLGRRLRRVILAAAVLGASAAGAHTRSESHSVWEIKGTDVDLVMTIPKVEINRLSSDQGPPSDDRVKSYLTARVYPLDAGQRCKLVPPVQTLSASAGYAKYDFTFKCAAPNDLQIHSGAFFDLVSSHTNFCPGENLRDAGRLRILITLVFGLIHGFGFAADLLQLQLPPGRLAELLVGFNVGVEIGQLILVVGATVLVALLAKYKFTLPRPLVVDVASAFLVGLGVFWFVSRSYAWGLSLPQDEQHVHQSNDRQAGVADARQRQ
jgi:hypothetical protein